MKKSVISLLISALLVASAQAGVTDNIVQIIEAPDSDIVANISGSENAVFLEQTANFAGTGNNKIEVSIDGNLNGGPYGAEFSTHAARLGITPGTIMQEGQNNSIGLSVVGNQNLFAMVQSGVSNSISGTIVGSNNQVSALQAGQFNHLSFSQYGTGNSLTVRQRSW